MGLIKCQAGHRKLLRGLKILRIRALGMAAARVKNTNGKPSMVAYICVCDLITQNALVSLGYIVHYVLDPGQALLMHTFSPSVQWPEAGGALRFLGQTDLHSSRQPGLNRVSLKRKGGGEREE